MLSAVVAPDGTAHDIQLMHPIGSGLDEMALKLVQADRFKPGTHGGIAVPVAVLIEVNLAACSEENKDETGKKNEMLRLQSVPAQTVEVQPLTKSPPPTLSGDVPAHPSSSEPSQALVRSRISAPVVTHSVEAQYPDAARKAKFTGTCLISLIVDTNGQPQNVHVVKSVSPSIDEKAIEAVDQYRFKPALKDGKIPVPVMITIEVDFRLY